MAARETSKKGVMWIAAVTLLVSFFLMWPQISLAAEGVEGKEAQKDTSNGNNTEIQQFDEFTKFEGNEIQNNPIAQDMLKKIEESKRILEQLQNPTKQMTENERFIEEQRRIAQEHFENEYKSFLKKHEENTPRNAFARFVSSINGTHQAIYWDQFNHLDAKIQLAKEAKKAVLDNGGSFEEAQAEYIRYASMPRAEMIQTIIDLNIKHGFTDESLQEYFDKDGKLPRYEDDDDENVPIQCFGCDKYENMRDSLINDAEMNPYLNNETAENKSLDTAVDSSSTNDNDADDSDYDSIDTGDSAADQGSQKNSIDFTDSTIQLASFVVDDNNNDDDAPTKETEGKVTPVLNEPPEKEASGIKETIEKLEQEMDDLALELQQTDDSQKQQEILKSITKVGMAIENLQDL